MDPTYIQGLRDAKALYDDGIFTQEEFDREKSTLLAQREERAAEKARMGVPVPLGVKRKREDGKPGREAKQPSKWAKYRKKCVHGKDTYECRACGGKRMCEHNKRRTRCTECSGAAVTAAQNAGPGGINLAVAQNTGPSGINLAAVASGQQQPPPPPPVAAPPGGGVVLGKEASKGELGKS